jgi:phage replication-related protein YjqB (UPF0714/DUF867 family)
MFDRYNSYHELAQHEKEGEDYQVVSILRPSPVAILALHGGGIEPGTSEIACALAGERYSLYLFDVLKGSGAEDLHLTSTHFDEPRGQGLVQSVQWALSIHGCIGDQPMVYLGGLDRKHTPLARRLLDEAGFEASAKNHRFSASDPGNLCNQGRSGKGMQLELTKGLRLTFFKNLETRFGRQQTTRSFSLFVIALQQIVSTIEAEISR